MQRLADRQQIADALARYARGIDRRDWELVRSVFLAEATSDHGDFKGDRDGFVAWIAARHATIARSSHHLCNCLVEFLGPDSAVAETYFIARMRMGPEAGGHRAMLAADAGGGDLIVEVCGRYADRFARRDGEWRIARRITIFDFSESRPAPPVQDTPGWAHGVRGPADPLYRLYGG